MEREKGEYVLVETELEYSIVNIKDHSAVLISNDELEDAVIEKMIEEKIPIFTDVNAAFESYIT